MNEMNIHSNNPRYFKNQKWPFIYYCDLWQTKYMYLEIQRFND